MESISGSRKVSFAALQTRLIRFVNLRIQNGDFTERGLARLLGISQSQIHNVLKGARKLTPELADHLMRRFDMSVLDLLDSSELQNQISCREGEGNSRAPRSGAPGAHVPVSRQDDLRKMKRAPTREDRSMSPKTKAG